MAFVELSIVRPTNEQVFVYSENDGLAIDFEGSRPSSIKSVTLYYRWYSSLNDAVTNDHYSLNQLPPNAKPGDGRVHRHENMPMGSHVIAFAATNEPSESNIPRSLVGGVAGGMKKTKQDVTRRYVIHVLKANILSPDDGAIVSPDFEFKAEAPWAWKDLDYQKYNGLRYRWKFDPLPANRPTLDFPSPDMTFHDATKNTPAMLVFKPVFPPTAIGAYKVTLYVQGMVDSQVKGEATDRREILI